MRSRPLRALRALLAASVLAASVLAASGAAAAGREAAKPLSRGALAARGDGICHDHSRRIATAFERLSSKTGNKPSQAKLLAFVGDTVVPEIRASMDELAALVPPAADAAAFRDAVATGRRELAVVERRPALALGAMNPFAATAKKFKALGFERCAQ